MTTEATVHGVEPIPQPFASPSAITAPPGGQPPPTRSLPEQWRSLHGLGSALTVLFVVAGVLSLLTAVALVNRLAILDDFDGETVGFDRIDRVRGADDLVRAGAIPLLVLTLAIAAVFIVWMWRAAKNNEALGRDQARLGPGWSIAGWFIPLASFVIPVLVAQDLWRGSTARIPRGDMRWRIAGRSALIGWWWGALLVSLLRGPSVASTDATTELETQRAGDAFGLLGALLGVAAAVLAILVVRAIAARQDDTLRAQQAAWSAAHTGEG